MSFFPPGPHSPFSWWVLSIPNFRCPLTRPQRPAALELTSSSSCFFACGHTGFVGVFFSGCWSPTYLLKSDLNGNIIWRIPDCLCFGVYACCLLFNAICLTHGHGNPVFLWLVDTRNVFHHIFVFPDPSICQSLIKFMQEMGKLHALNVCCKRDLFLSLLSLSFF